MRHFTWQTSHCLVNITATSPAISNLRNTVISTVTNVVVFDTKYFTRTCYLRHSASGLTNKDLISITVSLCTTAAHYRLYKPGRGAYASQMKSEPTRRGKFQAEINMSRSQIDNLFNIPPNSTGSFDFV